ncbi:MAG: hypothetical protein ABR878_02450 [Roseiarcus sp.]|jgi:hypothetical protein
MQWMRNLLSPDIGAWQIAAIGGVVVAIALILVVVYRIAFGHRLRVPGGGRARQPRLGLVDAFSLDGQRQLVLVRRDNIEHLIMIGGPNDILVESQIIRAAASPLARERDAAAVKALAGAIETRPPPLEPAPQPPRVAPRVDALAVKPAEPVAPAPARPAIRAGAPVNADARPEPAMAKPAVAPPAKPVAAAPARPAAYVRAPLPPPIVVGPATRPRTTPVPPPPPEPPAAPIKESPSPIAPAPQGGPPARPEAIARPPSPETPAPPVKPKAGDPFADLESLEAEMARLLGRNS